MTAPPVPTSIVAQPTSSRPAPGRPAPNPLLNPNQSLSGQALLNAAQQLANVQINPAINDLSKQIAANNAQTQGTIGLTGGYYNQLEPFVQKGVDQSGQIASGLNDQLKGIGDQTQTQLQGIGQGALSSLNKYVPQGDGGIANSATADLAAQIAKQQGLAAQQSKTARNFGASQGANYQQLNNSQLGTYGLQGEQALKGIAQSGTVRNEPLVSKIAGLQQQRGALVATDLGKLRQQEVANGVARAGLGLKQQGLQVTAANDQAKLNATLRGQNITAQKNATEALLAGKRLSVQQQNDLANQALRASSIRTTAQNDQANQALKQAALNLRAATAGKGGGSVRPLTTSQQNTMYRNLDEMATLIQAAHKQGESAAAIKQALSTGAMRKGFPAQSAVMVEAAYELLGWGHVLPQTASLMHGMGLRGGTFQGKPIRVAPSPQNSRAIGPVVSKTAGF